MNATEMTGNMTPETERIEAIARGAAVESTLPIGNLYVQIARVVDGCEHDRVREEAQAEFDAMMDSHEELGSMAERGRAAMARGAGRSALLRVLAREGMPAETVLKLRAVAGEAVGDTQVYEMSDGSVIGVERGEPAVLRERGGNINDIAYAERIAGVGGAATRMRRTAFPCGMGPPRRPRRPSPAPDHSRARRPRCASPGVDGSSRRGKHPQRFGPGMAPEGTARPQDSDDASNFATTLPNPHRRDLQAAASDITGESESSDNSLEARNRSAKIQLAGQALTMAGADGRYGLRCAEPGRARRDGAFMRCPAECREGATG